MGHQRKCQWKDGGPESGEVESACDFVKKNGIKCQELKKVSTVFTDMADLWGNTPKIRFGHRSWADLLLAATGTDLQKQTV